jgi:hypothetical protein
MRTTVSVNHEQVDGIGPDVEHTKAHGRERIRTSAL